MKFKKYRNIIIYLVIFAVTIFLFYEALLAKAPGLWQALRSGNEADVEKFLAQTDKWTGLIFLGMLQFIQVISIVLPGLPIQIAGGMVYGAVKAYIICHFMYIFANVAVMTAVRKFSGLSELLGANNQSKIQKALNFINQGEPLVTVSLLCMLPLVPNGIIPYAASQMDVRITGFAKAVFWGSLYPVLTNVLVGRFIITGNYIVSAVLLSLNILLVILVYIYRDKLSALIQFINRKKQAAKKR